MPLKPFFAGPGIDRADAMRNKPEEIAKLRASPEARALAWRDGVPDLDTNGSLVWGHVVGGESIFLGIEDGAPRFTAIPESLAGQNARSILAMLGADDAPTFAAALSLATWHLRHGFCSVCGSQSDIHRGGWARRCEPCGAEHFPRVDPVVIMLATYEDRLLLGRQPIFPPRRYSALAGFVEPGETVEAAVARELSEEAGISTTDVRYLASQPWPFPNSLMIGCIAAATGDTLTIDRDELDDARWFTRGDVAAALAGDPAAPFLPPPHFAIARTLLDHWVGDA